jgi:hypothetical protein
VCVCVCALYIWVVEVSIDPTVRQLALTVFLIGICCHRHCTCALTVKTFVSVVGARCVRSSSTGIYFFTKTSFFLRDKGCDEEVPVIPKFEFEANKQGDYKTRKRGENKKESRQGLHYDFGSI